MEAFIPSYPDVEWDTCYRDIVRKYEFVDDDDGGEGGGAAGQPAMQQGTSPPSTVTFTEEDFTKRFFRYQTNVARFLSAKTLYNSLLVIHEMGTGKSGSAIATAYLVRSQDPSFQRVLVLANGKTQLNNFRQEVLLRLPFLYAKHNDTKDARVILRREGFVFETYRIFARQLQGKTRADWKRMFERSILIMDEIHNLTSTTSGSMDPSSTTTTMTTSSNGLTNVRVYKILYDFVHSLHNYKLLCLTGTPIRDKPQEIANVLNLVIPIKNRLPTGEEFRQTFLDVRKTVQVLGDATLTLYDFRRDRVAEFSRRIQGYVSYLKKSLPRDVTVEYMTNPTVSTADFLDHFRVHADVMREPQNTMYLEAFAEDLEATGSSTQQASSSAQEQETEEAEEAEEADETEPTVALAYSRCKKVGLFAFPEKETTDYVRPIYEKKAGTSASGRFLKSMGWTKSMRALFPKDIPLETKFAKVREYSTIYASILRQIIDHPSELVYIYSFLKSGPGVYVLASFLVEYFQFEIVRKPADVQTKATTRRRLLILNHDFMTDAELRDMVNLFNRDENATGDYIQAVIGTKQTKEGITLKNIRQIHIVQPDWNYADISQAIGRGIRVGSHNALLERVGSVRVRIFQHAAVPMIDDQVDLSYSIDMEQYRRSEIKDRNIKMVERRLLEASWDCALNRTRNTGLVDGSRGCEYTTCKYRCDGMPMLAEQEDRTYTYDTFNAYYADMARQVQRMNVSRRFHTANVYTRTSLFGTQANRDLVERTLAEVMMNNVGLADMRSDTTYLRYDAKNRVYFLVDDRDVYAYYGGYYQQTPLFYLPSSFEVVSQHLYAQEFPLILEGLMDRFYQDTSSHDDVRTVILQSPLYLQEKLVETIIQERVVGGKPPNPFYDFVLGHYKSQARLEARENGNVYVSTILPDVQRMVDIRKRPFAWTTVEHVSMPAESSEEDTEFIRKYITENPYGYYGIMEVSATKTVFKIRDVRNQELVFGANKAKVPKGEVCAGSFSRKKAGLVDILLTLRWQPRADDAVMKMSRTMLLEGFRTMKDKSKLWSELKRGDVETASDETLRAVYALSTGKIPDLCALARTRFEELDLLFQKRV